MAKLNSGTRIYGNVTIDTFVTATGNVTGGNILTVGMISATGNIAGNFFIGNGSQLTGIAAGSSYGNANVVANLAALGSNPVSTTGNITGGNILGGANVNATTHTGTTVSVTANVTGGNILTAGLISATGAITGAAITGSSLTVSTGNITGGNLILSGAIVDTTQLDLQTSAANANIVFTPNGTGNVNTGANLSVTGNIQGGNLRTAGLISATGNITGGNVLGGANVNATTHTGTTVSVTGNITGGNVLGGANVNATTHTGTTVSVTGNITGGNLLTGGVMCATGNVTGGNIITSGSGGNVTGANVISATTLSATANITGGNILTGGLISATGTITTGGNISIIGNIVDTGALWINTTANGNITLNANGTGVITFMNPVTNGAANGVGNIGNSTGYFNTVFAKATSAQYADLAEMYVADADYLPGTVLEFGGNHEVTVSNTAASALIAGVVSTNPAHLMNSTAQGKYLAAIALVGRVPTLVVGPVSKGAMMVSAGNGHAQASATPAMGTVIGKAVEDFTGASGIIEIAVGRV